MPTTYTLTAIIDPAQVDKLKADGLSLCFGKVVQDASGNPTLNVIWNSNPEFLSENNFEWQETYHIAGAEINVVGALATAATQLRPIGLGQTVTIASDGDLGIPTGPIGSGPITLYNYHPKVNFSALLFCTGATSTEYYNPNYISTPIKTGLHVELTPIETVAVWFAKGEPLSSLLIDNASNTAYNVTYLSGATSHTISWLEQTGGKWDWEITS